MVSLELEGSAGDAASSAASGSTPNRASASVPDQSDAVPGTPEHLQWSFARAVAAADRGVGPWVPRTSDAPRTPDDLVAPSTDRGVVEFRARRAIVRASATAYARRLRSEGATPEGMLVLVKGAMVNHRIPGFSAQELTNDIIRWSIEAYFDG
jgi:hypothetical protein